MRKLLALLALFASPAWAALTVVDQVGTTAATNTTHSVSVPGGSCTNGNVLVGIVGSSAVAVDVTFPAGYTSLLLRQGNSEMGEPFYHECDGSEGATFTVTFSVTGTLNAYVYEISGQDNADDPQATATGGAASTTADPPSLTPTGGSKAYLWITVAIQDDTNGFTSCPTNYTTNCVNQTSDSGTAGSTLGASYRTNTGTVEDPGVFTFATSDTWDAYTISVSPGTPLPTFTAGPAAGTYTQTTMPVTFTSDTTGTVKGVVCTNGNLGNATNTLAGQCSGGSGAVATISQAVVATVSDGDTFTGLTAGTTYDLGFVIDAATDSNLSTLADQTTVAVPTFSTGPATGTLTSTTAQITGTPDQSGTWYGLACTNGQTATVAQVKTGTTCSGGAAIAAFNKSVTAATPDSQTFTGLSAATIYDTFHVINNAAGDSASVPLADVTTQAAAAPSFTSGPSIASATDGYTVSGTVTCTGTCTVEAVACAPGDSAPTANEIEAGQCGGGNAAILNAQENWATGVGDSFALTAANKPHRLSIYVSATNGANDSSVVSFLSQNRSARTGYAFVTMSSHSAAGLCNLDSYFTPDCADGDVFEYEDDTNEDADCNVSISATGELTLTPVATGDCDGRQTFEISYEDVSSATDGLFTAPTVGNYTTDDTVYVNNQAPTCDIQSDAQIILLTEDVAMTAIDLKVRGDCSDPEDDQLTFAVSSGTEPTGLSRSGTGNKDLSGTPTTENEAGATVVYSVCDIAGDCTTLTVVFYVVNTWTVPNCVGVDASGCSTLVVAAAPWRVNNIGVTIVEQVCRSTVLPGIITAQEPAATAQADPSEAIEVSIATDTTTMPDVTGLTAAAAVAIIEALCP